MLKIIKRYSVVSILIILCFFSAFIALCSGSLQTASASRLIQRKNQYAYKNEVQVVIRPAESLSPDILSDLVSSVASCNIYLDGMEIYFDGIDGVYRPDILLRQNEKLSLPTSKNIYEIPSGYVIAADSNVEGFDELSIHGKSFAVLDRMDTEEFPFVTGLFVLGVADYFEAFPDCLNGENEVVLLIASNDSDVYFAYSQLQNKLQELLPGAIISHSDIVLTESIWGSVLSQENLISAGLFLFALINTAIISYYWVTVRRHEIAIRKAFGAGNLRVIGFMAKELLTLIGISAVLALAVRMAIWAAEGNSTDIQSAFVIACALLLSMAVAVVVAMIIPTRYILSIRPSEGVKL